MKAQNPGRFLALLPIILVGVGLHAPDSGTVTISVREEGGDHGVESTIIMVKGEKDRIPIDDTDSSGKLEFPHGCALGERFIAFPKDTSFYSSGEKGCKTTLLLTVVRRQTIQSLKRIPPIPVGSRTPDDASVIGYKLEIDGLQGVFEAKNPGWALQVRRDGIRLAGKIGEVSERQLNPSRRIIKHEYGGWALLMVARSFVGTTEPEPEKRQRRVEYATRALLEFDLALSSMGDITLRFQAGDKGAAAVYEWMTSDDSADLYRTHYLRAIALAVIARAGGEHSKAEVRQELQELKRLHAEYLSAFPPTNNPDLAWAIEK